MNFQQFQASRKYFNDLSECDTIELGVDDIVSGYVYDDSFYIEHYMPEDPVTAGLYNDEYNVVIGRCEYIFTNLSEAEQFLWNEFAKEELYAQITHTTQRGDLK